MNYEKTKKGKQPKIFIEYNGRKYTIPEFSEEFKIPKNIVYGRYRNGWSPENIIAGTNKYKKKCVEFNGEKISLNELARRTNIPLPRIIARYNSGKDIYGILSDKLHGGSFIYDNDGNKYTAKEISDKFGVGYQTVLYRAKKNYSFDRIIKETNKCKPKMKRKMNTDNGEKTLVQISKEFNIPYHIVYSRFKRGWDYEKIISTPHKKQDHAHSLKVMYNGELLPLADVAKKMGVKYNTLYVRVKRGYSCDEIVSGRR